MGSPAAGVFANRLPNSEIILLLVKKRSGKMAPAPNVISASVTRIADFSAYSVEPLPRSQWAWGDYAVGEVTQPPSATAMIELCSGRLASVDVGDLVIGAFATRFATLESTGSWEYIGDDNLMSSMTSAGLFGVVTSRSPFGLDHVRLRYVGHVIVEGEKQRMADYARGRPSAGLRTPVLLIVGSSMSAGKTQSARILIRRLKTMGRRVIGVKLTGAGRYRDILTMGDSGADAILDFVDAGLPSTVCEPEVFSDAARRLFGAIDEAGADIAVVEAGASPLEPYNGDTATALLRDNIRMTLLCASDPYSVVGMVAAFDRKPDLVAGIATNTDAGQALIRKLTGLPTLRLMDRTSLPQLDALLREKLRLE